MQLIDTENEYIIIFKFLTSFQVFSARGIVLDQIDQVGRDDKESEWRTDKERVMRIYSPQSTLVLSLDYGRLSPANSHHRKRAYCDWSSAENKGAY